MSKHYLVLKYYSNIKKFEIQCKKAYDFEVHEVYVLYAAIGSCIIIITKFSKWKPKKPTLK